jgi:hypothetical protein
LVCFRKGFILLFFNKFGCVACLFLFLVIDFVSLFITLGTYVKTEGSAPSWFEVKVSVWGGGALYLYVEYRSPPKEVLAR